jgi:hypothetical protein
MLVVCCLEQEGQGENIGIGAGIERDIGSKDILTRVYQDMGDFEEMGR